MQNIITELDELDDVIHGHTKSIEDAFDKIDDNLDTWNLKRRELLKDESKKVLKVLSERDTVSLDLTVTIVL
jgi:hypothetical protein